MTDISLYGKKTLLQLVQDILEKMTSDEVNSIHDTPESIAVAGEVRDSYRAITAGISDYHRKDLLSLEGVSNSKYFNQLKVPERVIEIENLWYDVCSGDSTIRVTPDFVTPEEFLERSNCLASSSSCDIKKVQTVNGSGAGLFVKTTENPSFYTSFDNRHLFFNAVNLENESALSEKNSSIWAVVSPEFKLEDSFVPLLRVDEFTHLLEESLDACFIHFKGVSHSKAQKRARHQRVRAQNNRRRVSKSPKSRNSPPYGRHP